MAYEQVGKGKPNLELKLYRPCECGCDQRDGWKGVGYLSGSDDDGNIFLLWIEDERIYTILTYYLWDVP